MGSHPGECSFCRSFWWFPASLDIAQAHDNRLVKVVPRPNEDKRFHNICLKGIVEVEHIYGEARIQSPMRRTGERGSGEFEVISWSEFLEGSSQR